MLQIAGTGHKLLHSATILGPNEESYTLLKRYFSNADELNKMEQKWIWQRASLRVVLPPSPHFQNGDTVGKQDVLVQAHSSPPTTSIIIPPHNQTTMSQAARLIVSIEKYDIAY